MYVTGHKNHNNNKNVNSSIPNGPLAGTISDIHQNNRKVVS